VSTDGQPLQYSEGRTAPVNAEPYTRISTLSGALDDKQVLIDWSAARAMIGMVKNDSIAAQVAHLSSAFPDPWAVAEGKKPLKELVRRAQDIGGSSDAAGMGTAMHGLCEEFDSGRTPGFVPGQLRPWIEARQAALAAAGLKPFLIEPFVVNDDLKVAGNPDRYLLHEETGQVFAADDKGGSHEPDYPLKVTIQVAVASRATRYDQATGKRAQIECNQKWGILIHTPTRDSGPAHSDLYWLDLERGWALAELATRVRELKKVPKLKRIEPKVPA
jgi:hypothetical protein